MKKPFIVAGLCLFGVFLSYLNLWPGRPLMPSFESGPRGAVFDLYLLKTPKVEKI